MPRPPKKLMFVGTPEQWDLIGKEFDEHLHQLCGLQPNDSVLDIGCGNGRIAQPLTASLTGRYEGFDVHKGGIKWCRRNITSRFPNFGFQHADIQNGRYNPGGAIDPAEFRFPYEDGGFDIAFATSVFTHMVASDVRHYLIELRRVLRGKALLTFYLWTADAQSHLQGAIGRPTFDHDRGEYRIQDPEAPEHVIAYTEPVIDSMLTEAGLRLESVHYGSWSGNIDGLSWQDMLIVS